MRKNKIKKISIFLIPSIISYSFVNSSFALEYHKTNYGKLVKGVNAPQLSVYETTDKIGRKIIKVDAWDNDGESGIAKVEFPNGEFVYPSVDNPYAINTEFYPDRTDTYTFKAYDKNDNVAEKSIHVTIADVLPSMNVYSKGYNPSDDTETIQIDCWVESGGANLSKLELPDGSFVEADISNPHNINYSYKATTSGLKTFKLYDVYGRYTIKSINTKVDEQKPNLEIFLSNSKEYSDKIAININAWDADYESGIHRVEVSDGTVFNIEHDDQYSINVEYIPSIKKNYTVKAYDKSGKFIEKTIYYDSNVYHPLIESRAIKKSENSYTLEFDVWTENGAKLAKFKLPDNSFLIAESDTYSKTVHYDVGSPGLYDFSAIDEFNHAKTVTIRLSADGSTEVVSPQSDLDRARELVELAELNKDTISIKDARHAVNNLAESSGKDLLQDRLNAITDISDLQLERKSATANLDVYIVCENMISMSLNTNSIIFENYSGVSDMEKLQALEISINSSLPYDLNAYMPTEIQNSDGSNKMDFDLFKIKENSESIYQSFENTTDKVILKSDCPSGNNISHDIDLILSGSNAHKADIYKTSIKFEAVQK